MQRNFNVAKWLCQQAPFPGTHENESQIRVAVDKYKRALWLDAGSTVTTPLRTTVIPVFNREGHYFVQGHDDVTQWCSDLTWKHFSLDKQQFKGKQAWASHTIGFTVNTPGAVPSLKASTRLRCADSPRCAPGSVPQDPAPLGGVCQG